MKVVNLKQAILQAWKERWSDYQWAINIKKNFPKGATWDYLNLAEALMEQAMIGPSPNPLILSYLKYAISSQMVSYSSVLLAISKFDDFSRELCVTSLLEIMDMFCHRLSCHGKAEECIGLCRAVLGVVMWLLHGCAWYCERLRELGPSASTEASLRACQERLHSLMTSNKNRALVHIARLEEQGSWSNVEQAIQKVTDGLGSVPNQTLRTKLEESLSLVKGVPLMLSEQSDPPVHASFPSVHAFIMLEGTMNLTGETQPLVEQLMMIKRMQRIPTPHFVLEVWKACFTGLIESPEGTEELKWTAFTFLKIPQVLLRLKKYPQGDKGQDFMEDVNIAFQYLLQLTPLLDKADQRCNCDCLGMLLQECNKLGLLSESNTANLTAKREFSPRLKTAENANIQPNPGLILRAEPTVTNILKTVDADHSKSPEGLLGVLGHMLSGKSLDLLLAAAAATGKLKSFARKFIKLNEFPKHISGEGSKSASVRALLFDISFLMLCHVVQTYGSEVILSDPSPSGETPFFETWLQTCMPEEGKTLNPDHPCFRPEPGKVESLVTLLNNSSEMKLVQVKWHEICLSTPAAILEVLNAWENGVLSVEAVQKITDNIKGKVCSMAICAVAWLVAHVRMLGRDEREKPQTMIRQLVTPLYGENTLQFYNERVIIMSSIMEHMCADVFQQTAATLRPPVEGQEPIPYRNLLPAKEPIHKALSVQFQTVLRKGWVDSRALHLFESLLNMGGVFWFTNNLVKELLKETRQEWANRVVELLYSIFCLDTQQITLTLLGTILPNLLTDSAHWHSLADPPGKALAKLSVWCALSSFSTHHRGSFSARQRKRQREDIEDYNGLFPLDDTQPSKLMRLLSSNEDEPVALSSPGDRSMSSSLSASQLHTVNMRDPLNRVLANLFLLISSILGSKMAGPHTQFVQSFMDECVESLEQGSRGSILQFMPFTMVSELVKLPALAKPKVVLAITDLTLPLGRRVAAKAISAL
ncbi:mediator of RNA polymerase II transcription subunit 24 [Hippoglossus hippoglossus]|nr:mediator of RNA polymerase II transcription subunit 24 [Hippoglossus hippoglossus]XP_034426755.1 mediator of RNA polymerase II transcription subunit 24 [Hippoglossus hippoglossus]XP_034426756.1 mediator of RNA polymerase II transcription subunit 24 [Hippoglossus hippoglossus]XP_035001738.1 mediator of RNA polymerase II transcription subunit 24 isoform X2 [Hippoglossus stenolepis]XP_035001740.1 mediator of RNA polymerase II transcription subunit 24 isoform X2 [Hippoglossus stenolepis]